MEVPGFQARLVRMRADCVVKLVDDHGVERSVKVRAESVYEAALKGLARFPTEETTVAV